MDQRSLPDIHSVWKSWLESSPDWQAMITGGEPKKSGCGDIYEIECPLDRPHESLAIADMRNLPYAEPHYHNGNETEIYLILQGAGLVVIAGEEHHVSAGDYVIIRPEQAHYTFPDQDLVMAVLNSPPFDPEKYICLTDDDSAVGFNKAQFEAHLAAS